jgi:hypothetical protein
MLLRLSNSRIQLLSESLPLALAATRLTCMTSEAERASKMKFSLIALYSKRTDDRPLFKSYPRRSQESQATVHSENSPRYTSETEQANPRSISGRENLKGRSNPLVPKVQAIPTAAFRQRPTP